MVSDVAFPVLVDQLTQLHGAWFAYTPTGSDTDGRRCSCLLWCQSCLYTGSLMASNGLQWTCGSIFPQDVASFVSSLPTAYLQKLDVIVVRKEGANQSYRDFRVRRTVVHRALQWLVLCSACSNWWSCSGTSATGWESVKSYLSLYRKHWHWESYYQQPIYWDCCHHWHNRDRSVWCPHARAICPYCNPVNDSARGSATITSTMSVQPSTLMWRSAH